MTDTKPKERSIGGLKADLRAANEEARGYLNSVQDLKRRLDIAEVRIQKTVKVLEDRRETLVGEYNRLAGIIDILRGK